jgi:hypothetical protein
LRGQKHNTPCVQKKQHRGHRPGVLIRQTQDSIIGMFCRVVVFIVLVVKPIQVKVNMRSRPRRMRLAVGMTLQPQRGQLPQENQH